MDDEKCAVLHAPIRMLREGPCLPATMMVLVAACIPKSGDNVAADRLALPHNSREANASGPTEGDASPRSKQIEDGGSERAAADDGIDAGQAKSVTSKEYPSALVREEQTIVIDGITETWRLRWSTPPRPYCLGENSCPCTDFENGEAGDLTLIRVRAGIEIDGLGLTRFFSEFISKPKQAAVQRWPVNDGDDQLFYEIGSDFDRRATLDRLSRSRSTVQVMHFGDYDHDGRATEFYMTTETIGCGHTAGFVVGLSKINPRLHLFGTGSRPNDPLYLSKWAWGALLNATGPIDIVDWGCGDHFSQEETTLELRWTRKGIEGTRRSYSCAPEARRLISTDSL